MRLKVTDLTEEMKDHGEQAFKKLRNFLKTLCTDPVHDFDEGLMTHICSHVRSLSSDGAPHERKALFMACRDVFPNTFMVIRDMAHAVRIAAKKPLHMDEVFGQVWEELFDKKEALVPMVQHSGKLREMLETIQRTTKVLRIPGSEHAMDVVLKHLAWAKQRFDSFADPCAKLSCMLLPVCVLLAFIASDERSDGKRRARAAILLGLFTPKFCIALGLSADYGLLCTDF